MLVNIEFIEANVPFRVETTYGLPMIVAILTKLFSCLHEYETVLKDGNVYNVVA